jgi:predicted ATPase
MVMGYVKIIKRIIALEEGYKRASDYADRHEETSIDFDISDKISELKNALKQWIGYDCHDKSRQFHQRRRQVKLACRLLDTDYYEIIR